ncbi:MAG: hypothetical protein GC150_16050 [Rhizobiales bacterium]|nr:hypothetical protein [Hyphomicrobiales bacterium]
MSGPGDEIKPLAIGVAPANGVDALRQVRELLFGEAARRHESGLQELTSRVAALESAGRADRQRFEQQIAELESKLAQSQAETRAVLAARLRELADDLERATGHASSPANGRSEP